MFRVCCHRGRGGVHVAIGQLQLMACFMKDTCRQGSRFMEDELKGSDLHPGFMKESCTRFEWAPAQGMNVFSSLVQRLAESSQLMISNGG